MKRRNFDRRLPESPQRAGFVPMEKPNIHAAGGIDRAAKLREGIRRHNTYFSVSSP
jgi:hypothetical protein